VSKTQSDGEGSMEGGERGACRVIVAVRGERRQSLLRRCEVGVGGVEVAWSAGDVIGPWDKEIAR
jgi:hypothetical protein